MRSTCFTALRIARSASNSWEPEFRQSLIKRDCFVLRLRLALAMLFGIFLDHLWQHSSELVYRSLGPFESHYSRICGIGRAKGNCADSCYGPRIVPGLWRPYSLQHFRNLLSVDVGER